MSLNFKKLSPKAREVWTKLLVLPALEVLSYAGFYLFFASVGTPWAENVPAAFVFATLVTVFTGIVMLVRPARWIFPGIVIFLFLVFKISGQNTSMILFFQNLLPFCPVSHYCVDSHFGTDLALFVALTADTMLLFDSIVLFIGLFVGAISLKGYWATRKR